jgi:formyl-CoA transferase
MSSGPLAGVTVIENASYISGPLAGLLLAQLGADVVKVEAPGSGDPFRRWGGAAAGVLVRPQFAALNHGKRSVALDLRTPAGRAGYLDLVAEADALVENFRPGTLDRLGAGEDAVRERNPGIVYVTVTGFGPAGPYRDRPAYDAIVQAVSGLWSLLSPVSQPEAVGPAMSDTLSGLHGALAVAAGLAGTARRDDAPRRLDVSMLAASLGLAGLSVATYAATGEVEGPYSRGRRSHSIALRAGDGRPLAVHLSSPEKFWVRLTDVVGRPDLRDDDRFASYPARLEHFDELRAELEVALAAEPRERWLQRLHEADVPAAPIRSVDEVVTDPHVVDAGLLRQASGPAGERFLVPRGAIAFAGDLDACPMEVPALGG